MAEALKLDPVKYEMFHNALEQALNESRETIKNLSGSVITREAGEVVEAVYLPNGDSALVACGILIHVHSCGHAIRFMISDNYGNDIGFYDGDHFINNDAHRGGMHKPDMLVIAPVFYRDELVGWVGNITHIPEIGAIEPGGMSPSAKNFYHEGITLPCVKIVERGKMRRDIMQMMVRSVRDPRILEIDTRAKIAGNERAKSRITELIDEYGLDFYKAALQQLVDDGEAQGRAKVKGLRPGIYRNRLFVDTTGCEQRLTTVELELEVKSDGEMVFRTPVISPQREGFNNCALPGTEGELFALLLEQLFYDIRWNSGTMRAVKLDIPWGSTLNVNETGAIGYCPVGLGMTFQSCTNAVLSYASFIAGRHQDVMGPCGIVNVVFFGGVDSFGRACASLLTDQHAEGGGARFGKDGIDSSVHQNNPWTETPDIEAEEMGAPLLYLGRHHIPDSGGFGRFRGGTAGVATISIAETPHLIVGGIGLGKNTAAIPGIYGGYPAGVSGLEMVRDTDLKDRVLEKRDLPNTPEAITDHLQGTFESLHPSSSAKVVGTGDIVRPYFHGGGGLGDPIEREPDAIVRDLREKLTTLRTAREVYCVDVDPDSPEVNREGTETLRKARRLERLASGIPARQFIKQLVARRNSRDLPPEAMRLVDELARCSPGFRDRLELEQRIAMEVG